MFQVMESVLAFFGVYVWTFVGYAIAFHILLPGVTPNAYNSFQSFPHAMLKVTK